MDEAPLLVVILAAGATGVYLLLSDPAADAVRITRRFGGAIAGVSLLLLMAFFGTAADWWPRSRLTPMLSFAVSSALSMLCVAAAVMTIAARRPGAAVAWFSLMLACNCGLLLFALQWRAAAMLVLFAASLAVVWVPLWRLIQASGATREGPFSREPLLACVAGALVCIAIVGTVRSALASDARQRVSGLLRQTTPAEIATRSAVGLRAAVFREHRIAAALVIVLALTTAAGCGLVLKRSNSASEPPAQSPGG